MLKVLVIGEVDAHTAECMKHVLSQLKLVPIFTDAVNGLAMLSQSPEVFRMAFFDGKDYDSLMDQSEAIFTIKRLAAEMPIISISDDLDINYNLTKKSRKGLRCVSSIPPSDWWRADKEFSIKKKIGVRLRQP